MDLLKRSELPAWLTQRFGSVRGLAEALDITRQTAHNLMTGRTIPNYKTCQKLGLEPMFMEMQSGGNNDMENLDDFLTKRRENASADQANQAMLRLLNDRAPAMWRDLLEATWVRANRIGAIDGASFEWNNYPFLALGDVAATFSSGSDVHAGPRRFRIVFGRKPTGTYIVDAAPPREVWEIDLSVVGGELVWNISAVGAVGVMSAKAAEQIIRKLVEYRDKYDAFYATGSWLK